jgi:Flp pilus assembly protein TadG
VAATEMGLILPLLMIITLGCVDFGRFAYTYIALTNAARAGAAYGCMNTYSPSTQSMWQDGIRQVAADELTGQTNFNPAQLTIVPPPIREADETDLYKVSITACYPFTTIVNWPGMPSTVTLKRTVVLRAIR